MSSAIKELVSQYQFFHTIYIDIVVAVITFFIVVILGKLIMKFVAKLLELSNFDYNFKKLTGIETLLAERLESFGKAVVYVIAVVFGLNQLNITTKTYGIIFVLMLAVFMLSFLLRVKDFLPNSYYGLKLKPRRYLKRGDKVKIKNMSGKVKEIHANGITLELQNKDSIFIPNLSMTSEELKRSRV